MKALFATCAVIALAVPAYADPQAGQKAPESHKLTVGELISIGNALASMDVHTPGGGQATAPAGMKFAGVTRMKFATIVDMSRGELKFYQDTVTKMQRDVKTDKEGKPDPAEQKAFEAEREKMFNAPLEWMTVPHIRQAELCLDAKPPECPVQNDIPIAVLGILFPIIDQ